MTEKGEYGFFFINKATTRWLKEQFRNSRLTIVFHNAKFDLKMLEAIGIKVWEARADVHCTLICTKVMNGQLPSYKLADLGRTLVNRDTTDKFEIVDWLKSQNTKAKVKKRGGHKLGFLDAPMDKVERRALWDVETTLYLFHFVYPRVKSTCYELYETERKLMWVVMDMENHGVPVDVTRARELRAQALKDMRTIQDKLDDLILPLRFERKKRGETVWDVEDDHFNPNSKLQMPAAFVAMGYELKYKTKPKKKGNAGQKTGGGGWSFDEYAMIRYSHKALAPIIRDSGEEGWETSRFLRALLSAKRKHKLRNRDLLPALVLKIRELKKMVSTYYDHLIGDVVDCWEEDGREYGILHCSFNQAEADTGRFSSSGPNLQNMPRILGPRECFVTRRGRRHFHIDYEQVEMKMFVHFAKDERMAKAIADDIHAFVATEIYNCPRKEVTKERRKRAKGVNFGIVYGSGPRTQAETLTKKGLPTTKAEATRLCANYHRRFPSVRRTTNQLQQELQRQGYCSNPFGRRYYIPKKVGYKMLNYLCQGTSADQMKAAMVAIWLWLRENDMETKIIMTIHDEIVLEVPAHEEAVVIPMAKEIMEDLDGYFVPITVDVEVVNERWSEKQDYAIAA